MRRHRTAFVLPMMTLTWMVGSGCGGGGDGDDPEGSGANGPQGGSGGVVGSAGSASGGVASDGGASSTGGAGAGAGGTAGAAGAGGQAGEGGAPPIPPGPPEVDAMSPEEGPYGSVITIQGSWLGNPSRAGAQLRIGTSPAFTIFAADESFVESWTEDEIRFRYPFPAEGPITIETPEGTAAAGEFTSSWVPHLVASNAPAASVIASLSMAARKVALLYDTTPPVLHELGLEGSVEHQVTLGGAVASSVRLYLANGVIEGVGVTDAAEPELVHLRNVDGDLVGELTGISLDATETALAGGPDGACAWLHRSDGWWRARPLGDEWTVDAGPIQDVEGSSPDRAVGASSDGSLYVAWSVYSGIFFDDMEAPRMRRLDPSSLAWSGAQAAGSSVDDFITSLEVIDKGRGVVVRYCGSDVDPFGTSGTTYRCFDGLHTPAGASIPRVSVDATASRHAFSAARAVAGYCDEDQTFRLRTDTDVAAAPDGPVGEAIVYPCQTTLALEIDPDGDFVPVVRRGNASFLFARRE